MSTKYVYSFGPWGADGDASMKNSLGGKGANLAEMCRLKLPVPAGFTISTEFCTVYLQGGKKFPDSSRKRSPRPLPRPKRRWARSTATPENPLLMSCRSGARKSMPGMMETVLNVGLCPATIPGLVKKSGSERFVWDAYRRLIMMYSDVVMEKAEDIEPADGHGIRHQLEAHHGRAEEAEEVQVRHRHEGRRPQEALRRTSRPRCWKCWASPSRTIRRSSSGAPSAPCSRAGRAAAPFPIADRRHSRGMGHRLQRAEHGLRQHGRRLGHGRGLQPQPGHRREQVLRRMARQCPG